MDAIELANTNKEVNAICIVTSDVDYYSLALKIREYGLFVLGIGEKKSNPLWIKSCDQFKYLENISVHTESNTAFALFAQEFFKDNNSSNDNDSEEQLELIIAKAYAHSKSDEDGRVSLSNLGTSIYKIKPDFSPYNYNHTTLRELIEAMPELYELTKDNLVPPNYWLKKKEGASDSSKRMYGTVKRWINYYGFIEANENEGDFFFHSSNIVEDSRQHKIKIGDKVSFDVFQYPNPDSPNSTEKNGRAANVAFIQ